jgi:hypothetical protein
MRLRPSRFALYKALSAAGSKELAPPGASTVLSIAPHDALREAHDAAIENAGAATDEAGAEQDARALKASPPPRTNR